MMMVISKKGQTQLLAPSTIVLVLAAIFLVFGLVMLQELRDTDVLRQAESSSVVNETGYINTSNYVLTGTRSPGANTYVITYAYNRSSSLIIGTGNYTVSATGVVTNLTATKWDNVSFVYSYLRGGEAYATANESVVGLGSFADFWEIIVLAIVITVVMGLLLVAFGRQKNR